MEKDASANWVPLLVAYRAARSSTRRSAIVECEARRVARTIGQYGALQERQLFELCKAESWRRGTFAQACDLAVELGWIRRLALGFYARPREDGQPASRADLLPSVQRASRSLHGLRALTGRPAVRRRQIEGGRRLTR